MFVRTSVTVILIRFVDGLKVVQLLYSDLRSGPEYILSEFVLLSHQLGSQDITGESRVNDGELCT